jgi:HSP20 family protein
MDIRDPSRALYDYAKGRRGQFRNAPDSAPPKYGDRSNGAGARGPENTALRRSDMARGSRLELMHDHVRVIYRTLTGGELPETAGEAPSPTPSMDQVERRFAELERQARSLPQLAERLAPFSFTPPLDLLGTERELVVEMAVPGVQRDEVDVDFEGGELWIRGARAEKRPADGLVYLHAEIARGPFQRVVRLPEPTSGPPRIEVEHGIIRVRLARASRSPRPSA